MKAYIRSALGRARTALTSYATTEPVRLRAALTSLVLAAGVLVPALADGNTAESVGGILAVVLPVVVGETARSKVTPVK